MKLKMQTEIEEGNGKFEAYIYGTECISWMELRIEPHEQREKIWELLRGGRGAVNINELIKEPKIDLTITTTTDQPVDEEEAEKATGIDVLESGGEELKEWFSWETSLLAERDDDRGIELTNVEEVMVRIYYQGTLMTGREDNRTLREIMKGFLISLQMELSSRESIGIPGWATSTGEGLKLVNYDPAARDVILKLLRTNQYNSSWGHNQDYRVSIEICKTANWPGGIGERPHWTNIKQDRIVLPSHSSTCNKAISMAGWREEWREEVLMKKMKDAEDTYTQQLKELYQEEARFIMRLVRRDRRDWGRHFPTSETEQAAVLTENILRSQERERWIGYAEKTGHEKPRNGSIRKAPQEGDTSQPLPPGRKAGERARDKEQADVVMEDNVDDKEKEKREKRRALWEKLSGDFTKKESDVERSISIIEDRVERDSDHTQLRHPRNIESDILRGARLAIATMMKISEEEAKDICRSVSGTNEGGTRGALIMMRSKESKEQLQNKIEAERGMSIIVTYKGPKGSQLVEYWKVEETWAEKIEIDKQNRMGGVVTIQVINAMPDPITFLETLEKGIIPVWFPEGVRVEEVEAMRAPAAAGILETEKGAPTAGVFRVKLSNREWPGKVEDMETTFLLTAPQEGEAIDLERDPHLRAIAEVSRDPEFWKALKGHGGCWLREGRERCQQRQVCKWNEGAHSRYTAKLVQRVKREGVQTLRPEEVTISANELEAKRATIEQARTRQGVHDDTRHFREMTKNALEQNRRTKERNRMLDELQEAQNELQEAQARDMPRLTNTSSTEPAERRRRIKPEMHVRIEPTYDNNDHGEDTEALAGKIVETVKRITNASGGGAGEDQDLWVVTYQGRKYTEKVINMEPIEHQAGPARRHDQSARGTSAPAGRRLITNPEYALWETSIKLVAKTNKKEGEDYYGVRAHKDSRVQEGAVYREWKEVDPAIYNGGDHGEYLRSRLKTAIKRFNDEAMARVWAEHTDLMGPPEMIEIETNPDRNESSTQRPLGTSQEGQMTKRQATMHPPTNPRPKISRGGNQGYPREQGRHDRGDRWQQPPSNRSSGRGRTNNDRWEPTAEQWPQFPYFAQWAQGGGWHEDPYQAMNWSDQDQERASWKEGYLGNQDKGWQAPKEEQVRGGDYLGSGVSQSSTSNQGSQASSPSRRSGDPERNFKRTQCKHFREGNCKEGNECSWAHGQEQAPPHSAIPFRGFEQSTRMHAHEEETDRRYRPKGKGKSKEEAGHSSRGRGGGKGKGPQVSGWGTGKGTFARIPPQGFKGKGKGKGKHPSPY